MARTRGVGAELEEERDGFGSRRRRRHEERGGAGGSRASTSTPPAMASANDARSHPAASTRCASGSPSGSAGGGRVPAGDSSASSSGGDASASSAEFRRGSSGAAGGVGLLRRGRPRPSASARLPRSGSARDFGGWTRSATMPNCAGFVARTTWQDSRGPRGGPRRYAGGDIVAHRRWRRPLCRAWVRTSSDSRASSAAIRERSPRARRAGRANERTTKIFWNILRASIIVHFGPVPRFDDGIAAGNSLLLPQQVRSRCSTTNSSEQERVTGSLCAYLVVRERRHPKLPRPRIRERCSPAAMRLCQRSSSPPAFADAIAIGAADAPPRARDRARRRCAATPQPPPRGTAPPHPPDRTTATPHPSERDRPRSRPRLARSTAGASGSRLAVSYATKKSLTAFAYAHLRRKLPSAARNGGSSRRFPPLPVPASAIRANSGASSSAPTRPPSASETPASSRRAWARRLRASATGTDRGTRRDPRQVRVAL